MKESILLIDGHSILNRAFYGLPLLTNSGGRYTNAVYGFLNIVFKVIDEVKPDHMAVAFDLSAPTFRHKMYSEYKGTRRSMPDELREQVPLMKEVLKAMNVKLLEREGFEADDMIGSMAYLAANRDMTVNILSGDRDLLQLVSDRITLILPKTGKGGTTVENFTPERVREVYKIGPDKIVDLKSMMGDSSDNIPGLPGVGEKTATNIILEYGSLENAHENLDKIKPKKAMEAFRDHYDLGLLSKTLATIKTDVDIADKLDEFKIEDFYTPAAYELFKELEFKNYLTRFNDENKMASHSIEVAVIDDISKAEEAVQKALEQKYLSIYLDIEDSAVTGLAAAYEEELFYIAAGGFITDKYLLESAKNLIETADQISTMGFKEQQNLLRIKSGDKVFDCVIAAYLLDPLRAEYEYENIAAEYAGITLPSAEEVVKEKITKKTVITQEQRARIAGYKAYAAFKAKDGLGKRLEEKKMLKLFRDIEMPLVSTLSDMECAGIKMNSSELAEFSEKLKGEIGSLEKSIFSQAGEEFNIQSPKQLGVVLFEKLKLPGGKKTKSGYSTAVDVLEKLAPEAPIINDILRFRQLTKLKSTYADALGEYVQEDGRIHSHFMQTVTATGRLSSTDPNMQNIPVRMELGRQIRKVFVPEAGNIFVDADYSQIELRVLAHMSGDEKLIDAYRQHSDIHRITASQVFGVPIDEVTPLQRRNAKAVNFGIVYGISSFGLSQDLSITRKEAQGYIQKYFETYPKIKEYLDKTVENAKENGYTTTLFGRIRPIPELKSSNFMQRSFGERVAMNSPIQGTAADIIKIAMNNVNKRLKAEIPDARLILQVHDELLIEAKEADKDAVCAILKEEMEGAAKLSVDMVVDMNIGSNWDEAH